MNGLQVEEGATVLQSAKDADAEEKAALDHVQQQRQLLIDENQACQDAIGDVHERKKVILLLMLCCCGYLFTCMHLIRSKSSKAPMQDSCVTT